MMYNALIQNHWIVGTVKIDEFLVRPSALQQPLYWDVTRATGACGAA